MKCFCCCCATVCMLPLQETLLIWGDVLWYFPAGAVLVVWCPTLCCQVKRLYCYREKCHDLLLLLLCLSSVKEAAATSIECTAIDRRVAGADTEGTPSKTTYTPINLINFFQTNQQSQMTHKADNTFILPQYVLWFQLFSVYHFL